MSLLLEWLANNPRYTNLIAAVLNLIIAGAIYLSKPKIFAKHKFTKPVFQMWLGQWLGFVVIFIVFNIISTISPGSEAKQWWLLLLLCTVEVQTTFALACGWLLFQGNQYSTQAVLKIVGLVFVGLILWDVMIGAVFATNETSLELWIFPSRILAMFAFLIVSVALFLRSKLSAVPFLFITIGYATAQLPIYHGTFVSRVDVHNWFTALAIGKLLMALTFYPGFFAIKRYVRLTVGDLLPVKPLFVSHLIHASPRLAQGLFWVITVGIEEAIRNVIARAFGYR